MQRSLGHYRLVRELGSPGLEGQEKQDIREDVRSLLSDLPARDRAIVQARAVRKQDTPSKTA